MAKLSLQLNEQEIKQALKLYCASITEKINLDNAVVCIKHESFEDRPGIITESFSAEVIIK